MTKSIEYICPVPDVHKLLQEECPGYQEWRYPNESCETDFENPDIMKALATISKQLGDILKQLGDDTLIR